jgi:hypothetical protein
MYQEIIQKHKDTILDLYVKQNYKKAQIAHKLIYDYDLDFTHAQVDSFRRSLNQYLLDWEKDNPPINDTVQLVEQMSSGEKYADAVKTRAKVLLIDIETSPVVAAVWKLKTEYVQPEMIIHDIHIISWAGKWLFEPEVFGDVLTPEEVLNRDDRRICNNLWDILDQADIVIAHNGDRFDIPMINARFLINRIHNGFPPSPYISIDTLSVAKKNFKFTANKLEYINKILGLTTKIETKMTLWTGCMEGKPESLFQMHVYNKNDVSILEEHYVIVRPWIKSHPNLGFYVESDNLICPTCGCDELTECGTYSTIVNQYVAYRCPKCGAIGRSRKSSTSIEKKNSLTVSLGR